LIVRAKGDDESESRRVISIVTCCHSAKLCANAADGVCGVEAGWQGGDLLPGKVNVKALQLKF